MNVFARLSYAFALGSLIQACHPVFAQNFAAWTMVKTSWSSADEKTFQNFVQGIGEAVESRRCETVTACLNSSANTYRASDPPGLRYKADCADFPYFLRGYFAWKNGLPFSFAIEMKLRNVPGNRGDLRYSAYGNEVERKFDVVARNGKFPNALAIFNELIPDMTDSGNFRVNYTGNDAGALAADFYPVRINRDSIVPGTVVYDPNGHVALIYKITDDGKVFYVDAHPDNALTTGTFGVKFVRSNPGQGAGFKNWRPVQLVNAVRNPQGLWIGGQIVSASNAQLPSYGVEQFFGTVGTPSDWTQSKFEYQGRPVGYYEYVRLKMAKGDLRIHPVDDFRETLRDLCESIQDRVNAVEVAVKAGVSRKAHPPRLPENIYGTQGEWETYSTPSRDAQLKVSFRDLLDQAEGYMRKIQGGDPSIVYSGADLPQELLEVYRSESRRCQIVYTNSVGQGVTLSLEEIRRRLFALSFDPYHCPELRWGASGAELSTCADDFEKRLWYEREQRLRNQHIRRYDIKMDFSLDELLVPSPNNGVASPVDIDIERLLMSL